MTKINVELNLSAGLLERLKSEAHRNNMPIEAVVQAAVEDYLLEDEDDAEILASFREGFRDALAGRVRSAREVLTEVRKEIATDGD
jgi:predicted transcriptional regulator